MRVIAGAYKGRHLQVVPGQETRPTSDKIKEAVFHRMGPFFDGGEGLDLFAGSGALGIEALSRGMDKMTFVDQSSKAVKTIHHNLDHLKIKEHAEVYRNNALRALHVVAKKKKQYSLILLDPPYDKGLHQVMLDEIAAEGLIQSGGLLYIEHRPEWVYTIQADLKLIFTKSYNKTTQVTILENL